MATDTAPPTTPPAPAPVAPPAAAPTVNANGGITVDPAAAQAGSFARDALSNGLKAWRAKATGTPPPPAATAEDAPAPVDSPAAKGDTGEAPPVPPAAAPAPAAKAAASSGKEAPAAAKETAPAAAEPPAPPASPTAQATPPDTAPADAPASAAPKRGALPAEYETPEWTNRFADDPLLRRTIARLEGDPGLSLAAKALKIAQKVRESEERITERRQQERDARELRNANPGAYVAQLEAQEAEQAQQLESARAIARMIATALDVSDDDPDFLAAGPQEGESHEEGMARFGEYVAEKSPLVQARLARVLQEHTSKAAAETAALRQDFETRIKTMEAEHAKALENARAEGRAEGRGATVAPPRANGQPVGEGAAASEPFVPSMTNIRSLLQTGVHARLEAARDARLTN